jgi:hypothetical protein
MAVSKADFDLVMSYEGKVPDNPSLACLETVEEVIAFAVAQVRAEQWDEPEEDVAELIVRGVGLNPDKVRRVERNLRRLGYRLVADRLHAVAGRRKHELLPLSSWPESKPSKNQSAVRRQASKRSEPEKSGQ